MVRGLRRRVSFTEQKQMRRRFWRKILALVLVLAAYGTLRGFFLSPYRIGSTSMAPSLKPGDRIIVSPIVLGATNPFTGRSLPGIRAARRGELVLVDHPAVERFGGFRLIADGVVRFFTFQLAGIRGMDAEEPVVKRVIGVPGDAVSMKGFRASVRPRGEAAFLSEEELASGQYDIAVPSLPAGWTSDLPFSGDMGEIVLGPGQYFLLSDNRASFHDSRSWGPTEASALRGLVIGRYWPFRKR